MMDVNPLAVINEMKKHGVLHMVHGHTHRPAIHDMTIKGERSERVVLGAWHTQGSVLRAFPDGSIDLASFPL